MLFPLDVKLTSRAHSLDLHPWKGTTLTRFETPAELAKELTASLSKHAAQSTTYSHHRPLQIYHQWPPYLPFLRHH
jgi:hypothetical protein